MTTLRRDVAQGFEYYKKRVPVSSRKKIRLSFMYRACANMTLFRVMKLTPFKEPEYSDILRELKKIPEDEWRGE